MSARSPRDGFGEGLLAVAQQNPKVVALCADLDESIRLDQFKAAYPERFFEVGVAEQNMLGVAAGMALTDLIPVASSFAVFNPGRNWDQLRVSICYANANVKIIGAHAGLSVGPDGATHQALEDIAMTRALPNLVVLAPTDANEAAAALAAAVAHIGPVYIRFGRDATPEVTPADKPFVIGKAWELRTGTDATICACGALVSPALAAAEELALEYRVQVLVVPTIKPLDTNAILSAAKATGAIISAEDAQVAGGLGGAIAELLAEHLPTPLERVGVHDAFGQSGTSAELYAYYGLDAAGIATAVRRCIKRKTE